MARFFKFFCEVLRMTRKIFINSFLLGVSVLVLCLALFFGLRYTQMIEEGYDRLKGEAEYARLHKEVEPNISTS